MTVQQNIFIMRYKDGNKRTHTHVLIAIPMLLFPLYYQIGELNNKWFNKAGKDIIVQLCLITNIVDAGWLVRVLARLHVSLYDSWSRSKPLPIIISLILPFLKKINKLKKCNCFYILRPRFHALQWSELNTERCLLINASHLALKRRICIDNFFD